MQSIHQTSCFQAIRAEHSHAPSSTHQLQEHSPKPSHQLPEYALEISAYLKHLCPQTSLQATNPLATSPSHQLPDFALGIPKHLSSKPSLSLNASHASPYFAASPIFRYSTRNFHQEKGHDKKKGQTMSHNWFSPRLPRHGKTTALLLLMILSVFGVVQGQSDCQIMIDWLPDMFNGDGTACCSQPGIACQGDRITQMYARILTLF
jgi:hypothetical protein